MPLVLCAQGGVLCVQAVVQPFGQQLRTVSRRQMPYLTRNILCFQAALGASAESKRSLQTFRDALSCPDRSR